MSRRSKQAATSAPVLVKAPSGIRGLDAITGGGLPRGRPTLVCGGSGCGKTLLGMEFLVRGIQEHDEPGVFMCFEEREQDLAANVASLGFDLPHLIAKNKLVIDQVKIERSQITETGDFSCTSLYLI
jgi:circadian clock protein KaiC